MLFGLFSNKLLLPKTIDAAALDAAALSLPTAAESGLRGSLARWRAPG